MRATTLFPLLTVFISAQATPNIVHDPTENDFNIYLQNENRILVSFTSRTLDSVLSFNAIFAHSSVNSSTLHIDINCDQKTHLCLEHDVNVYPTIRLFQKSEGGDMQMTRYRGPRTEKAIRSLVKKLDLQIISQIMPANLEAFKQADDIVIIAYLRADQEALLQAFTAVAEQHYLNLVFGYSTDTAIADTESISVPSIVCYKNTDGDNRVLNGHFTQADIESFLDVATKSMINQFKEKDLEAFMQRDKLTLYLFVDTENEAAMLRHELTNLAKKYEKYVTFATADLRKYSEMATNFLTQVSNEKIVEGMRAPGLVVHAPMNGNVFLCQQGKKIEKDVVEAMLTTILQGKATHGQVFGSDAPDNEGDKKEHDEL